MKGRGVSSFVVRSVAGFAAAWAAGGAPPAAGQPAYDKGIHVEARGIYQEGARLGLQHDIVLLERNGNLRRVSSTHRFRSGDRFRVEVEPNRAAFIYVLNRTLRGDERSLQSKGIEVIRGEDRRDRSGSRQRYSLLYPAPGRRPAAVRAGARVQLPSRDGYFVMDDEPGIERVYLVASERPVDVLRYFDPEDGRQRTGRPPAGGGGSIEDDVLDQLNARLASWVGNADVAMADEDAASKGIDVAGYGIVKEDDRPGGSSRIAAVEVSLRHLPRRSRR